MQRAGDQGVPAPAEPGDADATSFPGKAGSSPDALDAPGDDGRAPDCGREASWDEEEGRPITLGPYEILRVLGRGGMGVVYEAVQQNLDRPVALKVLSSAYRFDDRAQSRFTREAHIFALLQHENIVKIHDLGIADGVPYFAMELVEGINLQDVLKISGNGESGSRAARPLSGSRYVSCVSMLLESFANDAVRPSDATRIMDRSSEAAPGAGSSDPGSRKDPSAPAEDAPESGLPVGEWPPKGFMGRAEPGRAASLGGPLDLETLEAAIRKERLPASDGQYRRLAAAFAEVASGLQHAHSRGVVHRDIKPSNLVLDGHGRLRILDFGLAFIEGQEHVTLNSQCVGTPEYMSPEQTRLRDEPIGPGSDIYSFGVTLYEILTGELPSQGRDSREIMNRIAGRDPRPPRGLNPGAPRDLEAIVMKCLRKAPAERYATSEALEQDLRRFVRGAPIEARPRTLSERVGRLIRRNRIACGVGIVLVLALGIAAWLGIDRARIGKRRALASYLETVERSGLRIHQWVAALSSPGGSASRGEYENGLFRPLRLELLGIAEFGAIARGGEYMARATENRLEEVLHDLREARDTFPRRPDAAYHLARILLLSGRTREAVAELQGLLEVTPRFAPARGLATALAELGGWPGAVPGPRAAGAGSGGSARGGGDAEPAGGTDPGDPGVRPWIEVHRALLRGGWAPAIEAYAELLRVVDASGEPYRGATADLLLGKGLGELEIGDYPGAIEDFSRVWGWSRHAVEPAILLGEAYLRASEPARAEEKFRDVARRHPNDLPITLAIASVYGSAGKFPEALHWANQLPPGPVRDRTRAALLLRLSRWPAAIAAARSAVTGAPRDSRARLWLGLALLKGKNDIDGAIDQFAEAVSLDPRSALAHLWHGDALARRGDLERAAAAYSEAGQRDPLAPWPRISLAVTLERRGDLAGALGALHAAFRLDPALPNTLTHLERVLDRPRPEREGMDVELHSFLKTLESALRGRLRSASLPRLLRVLARIAMEDPLTRDTETAVRYARLAVEAGSSRDPEPLAVLARAQYRAGHPGDAIRTLEEADHLPHASCAIEERLRKLHEASDRLASYAHLDAKLDRLCRVVLVPIGATCRFRRGDSFSPPDLAWTKPELDDGGWNEGRTGIGYGDGDDATVIDGMRGSFTSLFVRIAFDLEEGSIPREALELRVAVDDGCLGYLNGETVCRINVDAPHDWLPATARAADTVQDEPLVPRCLPVPAEALRAGRNVLAFHLLNADPSSSDLSLIPELLGRISPCPEPTATFLESLASPEADLPLAAVALYAQGRLHQRASRWPLAVERFEELTTLDCGDSAEPAIRLADSLRAMGESRLAASRLLALLTEREIRAPEAWDRLLALLLADLRASPSALLDLIPDDGRPWSQDVRWLLGALERGDAVRINCGGKGCIDREGRLWSRDRFTRAGYAFGGRNEDLLHDGPARDSPPRTEVPISGTDDDVIYQSERWFPDDERARPLYRIPLPAGRYRVTLHFAEIFFERPGRRIFDALVEGRRVARNYDPCRAGFATKSVLEVPDLLVEDGFLEIEFTPVLEHPKISGIEVETFP